ncbi:MAG: hypothetical protein B6D64_14745 [Bacteroidetes bacterium 4484_276]|nr:MAG: hypothetical protein B6D64_14745 [Bacteroidetes bacterium 4484_276]
MCSPGGVPVKVFPNPTTGKVNITSAEKINTVQFINQYGQVVYHINQPTTTITTDLSNFSDGLYIVKVQLNNEVLNFRLIKK